MRPDSTQVEHPEVRGPDSLPAGVLACVVAGTVAAYVALNWGAVIAPVRTILEALAR